MNRAEDWRACGMLPGNGRGCDVTGSIRARRVLVTGTGAVGKSTVCRLVAEALERSTVIEADVVRESIVGGFVEPNLDFEEDFVEQCRLQREIVNLWIDRMVAAGFHTIVDDAPIPPRHFHDDYAALLADPTSVPIFLTASNEALRARLRARKGPFDDWFLENLDGTSRVVEEFLRDPRLDAWTVIDTTDLQPTDVAARIIQRF